MNRYKTIIASIFIIAGIILMTLALNGHIPSLEGGKSKSSAERLVILNKSDIDYSSFIDSVKSKMNLESEIDGLILFTIDKEFCSSCINEIHEYIEATEHFINSPMNDFKVKSHAFVIGNNQDDLNRVNQIFQFPFESTLVTTDSFIFEEIKNLNQVVTGANQMIYINLKENKLKAVIRIFSKSTEKFLKRNLIEEAFFTIR